MTMAQLLDDNRLYYESISRHLRDEFGGIKEGKEKEWEAIAANMTTDAKRIAKGKMPSWLEDVAKPKGGDEAKPEPTKQESKIIFPKEITKVSEAIEYLMTYYDMTKPQAIQWLKENATER